MRAALKTLAEKSGGLYSFAPVSQSLSALYQQFGRTLQSEYAITYVSPSTLRDGVNRNLTVSLSDVGAMTETNYNPGGVLPEVTGASWTLFGLDPGWIAVLTICPAFDHTRCRVVQRHEAKREGENVECGCEHGG